MSRLYHIKLSKSMIRGTAIVLLPGDPFRSLRIGEAVVKCYGGEMAGNSERRTHLASIRGENLHVTSCGIGGSSTSIAIDELARLEVETFIRVGTTGAIQKGIGIGVANRAGGGAITKRELLCGEENVITAAVEALLCNGPPIFQCKLL